jgi:hypothetical protein
MKMKRKKERRKKRERRERENEEGAIKNDDDDSFLIRSACLPGVGRSFCSLLLFPLCLSLYYV